MRGVGIESHRNPWGPVEISLKIPSVPTEIYERGEVESLISEEELVLEDLSLQDII